MKLDLIPWWVKLLFLGAILVAFSAFWYHKGYDAKDLEVKTEQLNSIEQLVKEKKEKEDELRVTSAKLQEALSKVKVQVVYVDRFTRTEIEKPIYNQCIVPESGVILMGENAKRLNNLREPLQ